MRSALGADRTLLLAACAFAGFSAYTVRAKAVTVASCDVTQVARLAPRLSGRRPFLVEPNSITQFQGRILLAGAPSYVWTTPTGHDLESRNKIFGVVFQRDGGVTSVPSPLPPGAVAEVRTAALPDGRWAAVFAEIIPNLGFRDTRVVAYWFGITDGTKWTRLEKLPTPGGKLQIFGATRLVRHANELAIAVPFESAASTDVAVFVRRNGTWRYEVAQTKQVSYAALGFGRDGNLLLGVVRSDTTEMRDANSLFLYRRGPRDQRWTEVRRLVRGGDSPIDDPDFQAGTDLSAITWIQSSNGRKPSIKARVWRGHESEFDGTDVIVSSLAYEAAYSPMGNVPLWVTQETSTGLERLRIQQLVAGRIEVISTLDDPYTGSVRAIAFANRVLIFGPVLRGQNTATPTVHTEVMHIGLNCEATDGSRKRR